jgi:hypothetical protein
MARISRCETVKFAIATTAAWTCCCCCCCYCSISIPVWLKLPAKTRSGLDHHPFFLVRTLWSGLNHWNVFVKTYRCWSIPHYCLSTISSLWFSTPPCCSVRTSLFGWHPAIFHVYLDVHLRKCRWSAIRVLHLGTSHGISHWELGKLPI